MIYDLIVVGGGAAGFFSAINYAERNPTCKVMIIEKSSKVLSKVKVSGGGRCNVTNTCYDPKELVKGYPRGAKELISPFQVFNVNDTIEWFAGRGVELVAEPDGRIFPSTNKSETIIHTFLTLAENLNIRIGLNTEVVKVVKESDHYELVLNGSGQLRSRSIIIASGGHPQKNTYKWLSDLGLSLKDPLPSLFTFNLPGHPIVSLMGVSIPEVTIKIAGTKITESGPLLITHWGLSGPVVLRMSAWAAIHLHEVQYDFNVIINFVPVKNPSILRDEFLNKKQRDKKKVSGDVQYFLPSRLWAFLVQTAGIDPDKPWIEVSDKLLSKLSEHVCSYQLHVKGKTTFKEEFVTCGGIELSEVNLKTMESKRFPGIYFAGEVLNIDGITGGYNFQSAWTTGYIAAMAVGV